MLPDPVDKPRRQLRLRHLRPFLDLVVGQQQGAVAVASEHAAAAHIIGDDPVASLARQLGGGILAKITGFRGKADNKIRPCLMGREPPEDVGVFRQLDRRRWPAMLFLQLSGFRVNNNFVAIS